MYLARPRQMRYLFRGRPSVGAFRHTCARAGDLLAEENLRERVLFRQRSALTIAHEDELEADRIATEPVRQLADQRENRCLDENNPLIR